MPPPEGHRLAGTQSFDYLHHLLQASSALGCFDPSVLPLLLLLDVEGTAHSGSYDEPALRY
jgi:hypothetical protein